MPTTTHPRPIAPIIARRLIEFTILLACCIQPANAQLLATAAPSQTPAVSGNAPDDSIRLLVEREIGPSHRVEVHVGQLDPRLQLAPCARIEPYLPPGARLWGRTLIGVRCKEGASWAVLLPVTVTVFGKALIAIVPLAAGAAVTPSDFRVDEVDLTREFAPLVADPAQLAGKVLTRPLPAGQPLRADALRIPPSINAGETVKIVIRAQGLVLSTEGTAMAPASDGQPLRVRTESGKVVTGTVRNHSIEVML